MTIETTPANGIQLAYETFGRREDPPILLIMGLGVQMLGWDDEFCEQLAGRGFFVIRYDNRDVGESTHVHDAPPPDMAAALQGDTSTASYTLDDLADDAAGLLDALGLETAHVVGLSMGGMIAQTVASRHAERVRSLTSIMSTTGESAASQPTEEAAAALLAPPAGSRDEAIDQAARTFRVIGSPGFPYDEESVRTRAARSYDRAYDPAGVGRQLLAIYASGDRTAAVRTVRAPTLVIHGEADPLVPVAGGRATAAAISGSELQVIPGMGHDLPRDVWEQVLDGIARLARRADGEADAEGAPTGADAPRATLG